MSTGVGSIGCWRASVTMPAPALVSLGMNDGRDLAAIDRQILEHRVPE